MHVVGVLGAVGLGAMHGDARAGKLDLGFGLQATATAWPGDPGGGATIDAAWWFRPWIGASFIGKEQHARVDDRYLTYLSFNAAVRQPLGRLRLTGTLGLVHQHEEPGIVVMSEPLLSAFGVADGIRHRMAGRTGVQLALPFTDHAHGDWYVALDVDGTEFMDNDKGPRWMASAGLSIGFTYDFAAKAASR
jgi:hypothetical protein